MRKDLTFCKAEKWITCHDEIVKDETLRQVMVVTWNAVVKERDKLIETWKAMRESGDPLQALRAKQMIEITDQALIKWEIPELTRTVLERIVIHDKRHFTILFLDGTVKEVIVTE